MTEDKVEPREINWRQLLPWTVLFRSFGVAMGFSKLLLAASGILVMAVGWWLLAVIFYTPRPRPQWPENYPLEAYRSADKPEQEAVQRAHAEASSLKKQLLQEA